MPADVSLEGTDDALGAIAQIASAAVAAAEQAIGEEGEAVAQEMRDAAPRDTEELVASIQAEHDGPTATAAATADHSEHVEFGTSKMPARPYAGPAAERARERLPQRVADAVERAVGQ